MSDKSTPTLAQLLDDSKMQDVIDGQNREMNEEEQELFHLDKIRLERKTKEEELINPLAFHHRLPRSSVSTTPSKTPINTKKGKCKTKSTKRSLDVDDSIVVKKAAKLMERQKTQQQTADVPIQSPTTDFDDPASPEPEQSEESMFASQPSPTAPATRVSPQHSFDLELDMDSPTGRYTIDKDLIVQIEKAKEKHMDSLHHQTAHWIDDGWEGLYSPPAILDIAHFIRMSPPSLSNRRLGWLISKANKNLFLSRVGMKNKSVQDIKEFISRNQQVSKIINEDSQQIQQFSIEVRGLIQQLKIVDTGLKDSSEQIKHSLNKKSTVLEGIITNFLTSSTANLDQLSSHSTKFGEMVGGGSEVSLKGSGFTPRKSISSLSDAASSRPNTSKKERRLSAGIFTVMH